MRIKGTMSGIEFLRNITCIKNFPVTNQVQNMSSRNPKLYFQFSY